jgi:predicted ester cyclase
MSEEANKALVRRLVEEVWNGESRAAAEELLPPERVDRQLNTVAWARGSRPDLRSTIEDMLAEGDMVAIRYTSTGTHTNEWSHPVTGPIAPTGKQVTNTAIAMYRLANGKIVESWEVSNRLGLFQQLGATLQQLPASDG